MPTSLHLLRDGPLARLRLARGSLHNAFDAALIAEGGYLGDAARISRALRLVTEGVWMDLVIMERPYSREEGLATLHYAASAFFPRHFNAMGCIA